VESREIPNNDEHRFFALNPDTWLLSRELFHPIETKSNRHRYHDKTTTHSKFEYHARLFVRGLGALAVKMKINQCIAVCEGLTKDAVPSENDMVPCVNEP
jgi:hypothetical protein